MLLDVYKKIGLEPVSGEGVWLKDGSGKEYLDFYGGHAVALLGYAHPALLKALEKQARELFFQSNAVGLAIRERAAEKLAKFSPAGLNQVFLINSGAEANENALRTAFIATGRARVVAVEGAFHGRTAGSAAVTNPNSSWYAFPRTPYDVTFVPFDDSTALEKAMGNDVAAVIFEPVQGLAGARALSKEFVVKARALTRNSGALLIFDEVQCGMGRTGFPFAAHAYDIVPDILTTAKGLAGGFPAGAVMLSRQLAEKLKPGSLGTTFGGGPMACALIEAAIDAIEEEDLLPRVRFLSERIKNEAPGKGPVTAVQGMGYLLGLRTTRPAADVLKDLLKRGIVAGESRDPNVVRLLPPLVLESSHVDQLIQTLKEIPV
jgi:acetylornithine/N-succinyldiaminopimelate aminotransferase